MEQKNQLDDPRLLKGKVLPILEKIGKCIHLISIDKFDLECFCGWVFLILMIYVNTTGTAMTRVVVAQPKCSRRISQL